MRGSNFCVMLTTYDTLTRKQRDFEHLLFNKLQSEKMLRFGDFVESLSE